jgi:hypothetical protein
VEDGRQIRVGFRGGLGRFHQRGAEDGTPLPDRGGTSFAATFVLARAEARPRHKRRRRGKPLQIGAAFRDYDRRGTPSDPGDGLQPEDGVKMCEPRGVCGADRRDLRVQKRDVLQLPAEQLLLMRPDEALERRR